MAPLRFRLLHVFYVIALLGASLATCGIGGMVIAVIIGMWWYRQLRADPVTAARNSLRTLLWGFAIAACLTGLVLPLGLGSRSGVYVTLCRSNLKQIVVALHHYHDVYGSFPPAYVADDAGKPMHSWRVLILPFMEEQALYSRYRLDEPWNSPRNRLLLAQMPRAYQCPTHTDRRRPTTHTSYLAISGPEMAWNNAQARTLADFKDGIDETMLVLEGRPHQVLWTEPRDLTTTQAMQVLTSPPLKNDGHHADHEDRLFLRVWGRNSVMADGQTRLMAPNQPRERMARLLNISDGQSVTWQELNEHDDVPERLNRRLMFRLIVLALVIIAPWFWLRRNQSANGK